MPAIVLKYGIPVALLAAAWKFGKVPPKELLAVAAIAVAAGMIAPQLPLIGPAVSK